MKFPAVADLRSNAKGARLSEASVRGGGKFFGVEVALWELLSFGVDDSRVSCKGCWLSRRIVSSGSTLGT